MRQVAKFRDLPLIVGPGAPEAAQVLLDALTDRPAIQSRVLAASRISERRWNLHMKNGTDVMLPEGHEVEALDRLLQLQQETELLDRPLQAIDMRLGDRLVLRPQGGAGGRRRSARQTRLRRPCRRRSQPRSARR